MSYQVIARKWRPNNFAELIGQDHISQTLINAIKNDRLPHALLFTGLRGTGKTSSARILAKTLRCPNIKGMIPCETCPDCVDINSGRSVNVIEIDGASNNGVDSIRELRDAVGYMPTSGKYKIYIIDEVHMLSSSAFNALLKTLEEPPSHVVFIMATTEVHKVPHTILSRCQRFDFRRFPTSLIAKSLQHICKTEKVNADKDALWMIARQADGSLRDSQSLLDQIISFSGSDISRESVTQVLGLTNRQLLIESLQALAARDAQAMFAVLQKLIESGADPVVYCRDLLEEVRSLLLIKISKERAASVVDLPDSEIESLSQIAESFSEEDIHMLFDMTLKGANDIPRAQDPFILLEMLMMRMVHAPRISELAQLRDPNWKPQQQARPAAKPAVQSAAKIIPANSTPVAAVTSQPQAASQAAPPQEVPNPGDNSIQAKWSTLISRIRPANGALAAKLENSFLKELTDSELHIGVPGKMKFLFDQLNSDDIKNKIKTYTKTFWDSELNITISMQNAEVKKKVLTPKARATVQAEIDKDEVRKKVEAHPMIKNVNSVFKTRIVSITDNTIKETP